MIRHSLLFASLIAFSVTITFAQANPEKAIVDTINQVNDIKIRSVDLERIKREADKPSKLNEQIIKFPEIKEDFEQMQKLDIEIFNLTAKDKSANYHQIAVRVSEINRRAVRLKSNLFADEKDRVKSLKMKDSADPGEIKKLLKKLDFYISEFVTNPIFQNLKVVNLEDSRKAQKDLEFVIMYSEEIKNRSKTSSETAPQN